MIHQQIFHIKPSDCTVLNASSKFLIRGRNDEDFVMNGTHRPNWRDFDQFVRGHKSKKLRKQFHGRRGKIEQPENGSHRIEEIVQKPIKLSTITIDRNETVDVFFFLALCIFPRQKRFSIVVVVLEKNAQKNTHTTELCVTYARHEC